MKDQQKPNDRFIKELEEMRGKLAERMVHESEEKVGMEQYRFLLESIHDGVVIIDQEWRYLAMNDILANMLQMPKEKLIGNKMTDLFPGVEETVFGKTFKQVLETNKIAIATDVFTFPDGRKQWYQDHVYPIPEGLLIMATDITEHKKTEEFVQKAREYAENIVTTLHEPLVILDDDFRVVSANSSFYETFKVSPEETEQQLLYNLGNQQWDIPKLRELLEEILPKNTSIEDYEIEHNFETIGQKTMLLNVRRVRKEEELIFLAIEDITERKQAEERLKEYSEKLEEMVEKRTIELNRANEQLKSEIIEREQIQDALIAERERLAVTLRSIGDGMIATDIEGKITLFNKSAEKLTGWTQEEVFGKPLNDIFNIINEKTRQLCVDPVEKVLKTGGIVGLANDTVLVARDGTERIIADSGAPIHDKDRNVIGVVLVFSDITERKQAEEALRLQSEIVTNMAEGVQLTQTSDGIIVYTNPKFDEMFGYNQKELIGKHVSVLNAPTDKSPEETAAEIIKSLHEEGVWFGEVNNIKKDGTPFYCRASVTTLEHSQHGEVWVAIHEDITMRKEMEEKLIQSEKLSVLGQLAGGVGHELRNPLGAIKNAAYFLNMALKKPQAEVKETLEILDKEVDTSERIINSLLGFTRSIPPTVRKVDVNKVIQEVLSRTTVPGNIEVVRKLDEALPILQTDPDQISQTFGNIILNSIQAMSEGGRLTVKSKVKSPKWVEVSLKDTGVGIPKENLDKLFEPLFTTKAKGIGLGLALTKTLVEGNGGTIEVQSEEGKGTTFTVKLPIKVRSGLSEAEEQGK